jgi:hypothetical protein
MTGKVFVACSMLSSLSYPTIRKVDTLRIEVKMGDRDVYQNSILLIRSAIRQHGCGNDPFL